jgi:hypothetical protein
VKRGIRGGEWGRLCVYAILGNENVKLYQDISCSSVIALPLVRGSSIPQHESRVPASPSSASENGGRPG